MRKSGLVMRPSTVPRIERLAALVAACSLRDLGPAGGATLLNCSGSAARNYVAKFLDAGVITPMRAAGPKLALMRTYID